MPLNDELSVRAMGGTRAPRLPFLALKRRVLGKRYALSLAFIASKESRALNLAWRGKNKPANILSFPLSTTSGEILIDLSTARREAKTWGCSPRAFVGKLFIHGLFHLKGYRHGSRMERAERTLERKFGFARS